jgi:hypothetical protein
MDKNKILEQYWMFHPRFRFFKQSPLNANLLDIGAGSGGLFYWKEWGIPIRLDIKLHAIDQIKGVFLINMNHIVF